MFSRFVVPVLSVVAPAIVFAATPAEQKWQEFQKDPKAFMMKAPEKTSVDRLIPFSEDDVASGRFLELKEKARKQQNRRARLAKCEASGKTNCKAKTLELKAEALHRVEDFLDARELKRTNGRIVNRLSDMEYLKLRSARLKEQPWSDTYWPMAEGVLGVRYAVPGFQRGKRTWRGYADYVRSQGNTLFEIYERANQAEIDALAPSEKYDLLIGTLKDNNQVSPYGYLTPKMWEEGGQYADSNGSVEEWMGICQGWAVAAFMLPRPATTITLTAADGRTPLTFFPSDIKGLASLQWAYGNFETQFIGGRCDAKNVQRDKDTGRILNEECFDLNPGNFHVALVNQIGIAQRSMVLDATFDYEVWNQPIYSYRYTYVNPQTGKETEKLDQAVVYREHFTNDKFKRFRSNKAAAVVGVVMELTYVVETQPSQMPVDSPKNDALQTVVYMYDLEIDKNGNIIGGEWYLDLHPDFLWKPTINVRARSEGDKHLSNSNSNWNMKYELPAFWQDIARKAAAKTGMPLSEIVERMVYVSAGGNR